MAQPFLKPGSQSETTYTCDNCGEDDPEEVSVYIMDDSDIIKEEDLVRLYSDSGDWVTRWHCPHCGAYERDFRVRHPTGGLWVCPKCCTEWDDETDAAHCC